MREKKTQIKICGLTKPQEIRWIVEENADYCGMVLFFPKSRRNNSIENARKLLAVLHRECEVRKRENESFTAPVSVAVTVSPTPEQIREIEDAGFDMIQIHGELSDAVLEAVSLPVIRAVSASDIDTLRISDIDIKDSEKYINSTKIAAFLFDAQNPGSGLTFDWELLNGVLQNKMLTDKRKIFLAGGLNGDNVKEAVKRVRPDVVDVSSGVEKDGAAGGVVMKDREKIREFIRKVRADE